MADERDVEDGEPAGAGPGEVETELPARRGFLAGVVATALGGLAFFPAVGAAIAAVLDPLRQRGPDAFVLITHLSSLPDGGAPRRFPVRAARKDAWTTYDNTPVGAVYLRRTPDGIEALNAVCPHAGCFVALVDGGERFGCPCHDSSFSLDGRVNNPSSPSPRAMDALDVEIRNGTEVWIRFQNFLPGREDKVSV